MKPNNNQACELVVKQVENWLAKGKTVPEIVILLDDFCRVLYIDKAIQIVCAFEKTSFEARFI